MEARVKVVLSRSRQEQPRFDDQAAAADTRQPNFLQAVWNRWALWRESSCTVCRLILDQFTLCCGSINVQLRRVTQQEGAASSATAEEDGSKGEEEKASSAGKDFIFVSDLIKAFIVAIICSYLTYKNRQTLLLLLLFLLSTMVVWLCWIFHLRIHNKVDSSDFNNIARPYWNHWYIMLYKIIFLIIVLPSKILYLNRIILI